MTQLALDQRPLADVVADALRAAGWTVDARGRWTSPRPRFHAVGIYRGIRRDEPMPLVRALSDELRHQHTWGTGR